MQKIHIMGILNLTPDSFYAGSRVAGADALSRARRMWADGADVVDLGACSTRPGAPQPSLEEEWARLEPVLLEMAGYALPGACPPSDKSRRPESPGREFPPISIDTYRAEIVRRAYETIGPFLVNDISAGGMDPEMLETVGRLGLPYVAMHMRGTPETMQGLTDYDDVVEEVLRYFRNFGAKAADAGIREWILDPGFGFAKTVEQNYELLRRLREITQAFDWPVLVGLSRKSMIYKVLGITPEEAMPATQTLNMLALERGATWLRVHDVAPAVQTARLYSKIYTSSPGAEK